MKRIYTAVLYILCLAFLSGCSFSETEDNFSAKDTKELALSCFDKYQEEMNNIISQKTAIGETDWCQAYHLLSDGQYEFVLDQTGFVGTNKKSGILYIPDDTPNNNYIQDENNENIYSYEHGSSDSSYLERIQQNWFYFYHVYDF